MNVRFWLCLLTISLSCVGGLCAESPKEIVQQAVGAELAAARNDHSHWRYRQQEKVPVETVSIIVQTAQGAIREKIAQMGRPLTEEQATAERKRIQSFIHDPAQQEKQRRDSEHDDKSAAKLLTMLPTAFTWKIARETPEQISLEFAPDPTFQAPDIEARVMSAMEGQLVVDRTQHRIRTMRGTLSRDVNIGFGVLGKLRQGGTFDVERREVMPGLWQIVQTHVHIDGRALLFKTIGQQQDEVNSEFSLVPAATSLEQAVSLLREPKDVRATINATR